MVVLVDLALRAWRFWRLTRTGSRPRPHRGALGNAANAVARDRIRASQRAEADRALAQARARAAGHPSALPRLV